MAELLKVSVPTLLGVGVEYIASAVSYFERLRELLSISPFRLGEQPNVRVGVAMITAAPEALELHQKSVVEMWQRALKGAAAAKFLRDLMGKYPS